MSTSLPAVSSKLTGSHILDVVYSRLVVRLLQLNRRRQRAHGAGYRQDRVADVLLDVLDLLPALLLREPVRVVQYPHLLHDRRLARLSGAEQEQPVRGPVDLLVLLQLLRDRIAAPLLALRVIGAAAAAAAATAGPATASRSLGRLLGPCRSEAAHRNPRRPPARGTSALRCRVGRLARPPGLAVPSQIPSLAAPARTYT